MNTPLFQAWSDASIPSNGKPLQFGYCIRNENGELYVQDARNIVQVYKNINILEYIGLLAMIERAIQENIVNIVFHTDSLSIVNDLRGIYNLKCKTCKRIKKTILDLFQKHGWDVHSNLLHINRKQNKEAHLLSVANTNVLLYIHSILEQEEEIIEIEPIKKVTKKEKKKRKSIKEKQARKVSKTKQASPIKNSPLTNSNQNIQPPPLKISNRKSNDNIEIEFEDFSIKARSKIVSKFTRTTKFQGEDAIKLFIHHLLMSKKTTKEHLTYYEYGRLTFVENQGCVEQIIFGERRKITNKLCEEADKLRSKELKRKLLIA